MRIRRFRGVLLIFWLILAGLIVWFKVVPFGHITYSLSYPNKINIFGGKGFIANLTPADRVTIEPGQLADITGDPVYFSVFTPRTFSQAKVTITYQNQLTTSTPVIEAGVLVDNIVWRYLMAPLENKLLDDNFSSWSKIQAGDIALWQRDNKFSSVADFLNSLKKSPNSICDGADIKTCLALYNTDRFNDYLTTNYSQSGINSFEPITTPLQGAHQFYFIANGNQVLKFGFDFTDLNLDKKSDPVIISIYQNNNKIYSTEILDNFGGDGLGQVRNFSKSLSYPAVSSTTSLYKLEIKTSDDVVIKKITEAPAALEAIGHLHPVMTASLPISFWTNSLAIKLTTNNPASKQIVSFGNQKFSLNEAYRQLEFSNNEPGLKQIKLSEPDAILETDGVFSFAPNNFFDPEFSKIDRHFILTDNIKYVLADYKTPTIVNNFQQATVILNTKEAYREKGKYSFMISVPGLSLANTGNLKISNIKVEFSGRTLWDKIKEKITSYVN